MFLKNKKNHIKLFVKGTEFQIKIWQELLKIKSGEITSYSNLSKNINLPKANRAVGSAIGKNPISYIIPCHRVLRKDKKLGGYRWGLNLKTKMLEYENFIF